MAQRFSFEEMVQALRPALAALLGTTEELSELTTEEEELAHRLEWDRYSTQEWNLWR